MKVAGSIHISPNKIQVNNQYPFDKEVVFNTPDDFIHLYKALGLNYPKFHKMDALSKLGFLAVELLKSVVDLSTYPNDQVSLLFQNSYASLDTDKKHQSNISDVNKSVSPAVFVYTLPNIMLGEIAIRNKIYGENLFTLAPQFSLSQFEQLVSSHFALNKAIGVIGGWVDLYEDMFEAQIFFINKNNSDNKFDIK